MSAAKCWGITAAVLLLAVAVSLGLTHYGRASRSYRAATPVDRPGEARFLTDSPQEAYRLWRAAGFRGRLVLYLADRWQRLDPAEVQDNPPMSRPYPLSLYRIPEVLERERLSAATFLYLAALNGTTRGILALLSEPGYQEMRRAAAGSKFGRVFAGRVSLPHQGFPRSFVNAAGLARQPEPLLVLVAASYFKGSTPEELLALLSGRGVTSDCLVLCRMVGDPEVGPVERERLERFARLVGARPLPATAGEGGRP